MIFYIRDENRRRYTNADGTKRSSPDPRYYFQSFDVVGETSQSWLLDVYGRRVTVNKKTQRLGGYSGPAVDPHAYTAEQMEAWFWNRENRPDILRLVERCDVATLRKIADLVGYKADA